MSSPGGVEARRRGRLRTSQVVVTSIATVGLMLFAGLRVLLPVWPTSPPFPARYEPGSESATQFVEFEADGSVTGENLPVWRGESCPPHPERISGEGRWRQDLHGDLWLEIGGQRVKWDAATYRGWPTWEKVVLTYCADGGPEREEVWYGDWLG
jgi:hypothetical protein